jgi:hypothetical protein
MPREQVMCAAVSCGSAAADDVGLAGASLKWFRSLISGAHRFCSKPQAAPCYVARLAIWHDLEARSTAHCFLSIAAGGAVLGDCSQVLPRCRAFGPVFAGFVLLRQAIGIDGRCSVQY